MNLESFQPEMKKSNEPNFEILSVTSGTPNHVPTFVSQRCIKASQLFSKLVEVGIMDPQVAFLLLLHCGAYCKLVLLATTPLSMVFESLVIFHQEVCCSFADRYSRMCMAASSKVQAEVALDFFAIHCLLCSIAHHIQCGYPIESPSKSVNWTLEFSSSNHCSECVWFPAPSKDAIK